MRRFTSIFSALKTAYVNRSDPEGMQLLARTFWRVMLALSLVTVIAAMAVGGFQLFEVLGTFSQRTLGEALLPITVNRERLQKTLDGFEARQKYFESLSNASTTYPDPSR